MEKAAKIIILTGVGVIVVSGVVLYAKAKRDAAQNQMNLCTTTNNQQPISAPRGIDNIAVFSPTTNAANTQAMTARPMAIKSNLTSQI